MPYIQKTKLRSVPYFDKRAGVTGHTGLNGVWDDITGFLGSVGTGFATAEQQQGAINATMAQQQNAALIAQAQNQSPINLTNIVIIGGIGAVAYFMLKKK